MDEIDNKMKKHFLWKKIAYYISIITIDSRICITITMVYEINWISIVQNWENKTHFLSLVTKNLLKAYIVTSVNSNIILKKRIDNIWVIDKTCFSHYYIIVSIMNSIPAYLWFCCSKHNILTNEEKWFWMQKSQYSFAFIIILFIKVKQRIILIYKLHWWVK